MARAFVGSFDISKIDGVLSDTLVIPMDLVFFGSDLPGGRAFDKSRIEVAVQPTDTLAGFQTKIVDAVMAKADELGYTVQRTSVVYPSWSRGS